MKDPRDIIIKPLVSEKSYLARENVNAYTFIVSKSAAKPEISDAIESIFPDVKVAKVNTMNRKGKVSRNRRSNRLSARPSTKKAIVYLSSGEIDVFDS